MSWRRFQTFILVVAAGLILAMFMCDMCFCIDEGVRYTIKFTERSQFLIFTFVTLMLTCCTVGYYKQRPLQLRLILLNSLLLFAYQVWIIVEFFALKEAYHFTIAALFPLISIILIQIAGHFIRKDESSAMLFKTIRKVNKNSKKRNQIK